MFKKILIANRGEIALRVARTAHKMGIQTVAVYSDADMGAPHVLACDEAVHIGGAAAAESYLIADRIIEAAQRTGAQAIHPGYGFLSENAAFADALHAAGIVFIGPDAKTIRAMGSKSAAKDLMAAAGVPVTPGYQGEDQSLSVFTAEAEAIGYPVLLKAVAGGGGKGMRRVDRAEDLADALQSAAREGASSFGNAQILIEKYIETARHVEVQIFGDGRGNVVHFFERDCSVQRRHQKIIEEAPAPGLPANVREKLLQAGVDAGRAVDYRGAGTVEFLYDGGDEVYFMEMNTRLQVEHPVSEMITGFDLVEWQIRVAAGEPLPASQGDITENGHAFEARLYAENPANDFAPSIGTLSRLDLPAAYARIDSGVTQGQSITPFYDPMIAKIIVHGTDRREALSRLRVALSHTRVAGLETNASFLHMLAAHPAFIEGDVSTRFIDQYNADLFPNRDIDNFAIAAVVCAMESDAIETHADFQDPWTTIKGFRLNDPDQTIRWIEWQGAAALLRIVAHESSTEVTLEPNASAAARRQDTQGGPSTTFSFTHKKVDDLLQITINGITRKMSTARHGGGWRVWQGGHHDDISEAAPLIGDAAGQTNDGTLKAPMPGVITVLTADLGVPISAGETLLVMEAMKMEHAIKAPHDGVVASFNFNKGDQVKEGDLLVEFNEAP